MIRAFYLIVLLTTIIGISEKEKYLVKEICYDDCVKGYYRIRLKSIGSDSTFLLLSRNFKGIGKKFGVGDTIQVRLEYMNYEDLKPIFLGIRGNLEAGMYFGGMSCSGEKYIEVKKNNESFCKSNEVKGLKLIKDERK